MAHTPVAAWGGPDTCFQLEGEPPVERRPADGALWDYAGAHLGFYGFLGVADSRILHRVGIGLLDLSDRVWRTHYEDHRHPSEAADDAIASEGPCMGRDL